MINKIICISDTHGKHRSITIPDCDLLIHSGDFTPNGKARYAFDFMSWFVNQPARFKVLTAGNHDWCMETNPRLFKDTLRDHPELFYLDDSGCIIEDIKIWGSPISPFFHNWAFNRYPGNGIQKHWDMIPKDIDILITHTPVYNILDKTEDGRNVGCEDLKNTIQDLPKLKYHISGHIHEGRGVFVEKGITYVNACSLDQEYKLRENPYIDLMYQC